MKIKAGDIPNSAEALKILKEKAMDNDLTRFQRFKLYVKKNFLTLGGILITIGGIVTTVTYGTRDKLASVGRGLKSLSVSTALLAKKLYELGKTWFGAAYDTGNVILRKIWELIVKFFNVLSAFIVFGSDTVSFLSKNLWMILALLFFVIYNLINKRV